MKKFTPLLLAAALLPCAPGLEPARAFASSVGGGVYELWQYVEDKNEHKTTLIVGNETTGLWKKAFGMAKVEELVEVVRSVADGKGVAAR